LKGLKPSRYVFENDDFTISKKTPATVIEGLPEETIEIGSRIYNLQTPPQNTCKKTE